VAIVWVCRLGVDAYAEFGRQLDVPRFECPACGEPMVLWGFYRRYLRRMSSQPKGVRDHRTSRKMIIEIRG